MRYDAGSCDVAVVGAGHAGIEAALAAARLGLDTVCFTINMDAIGNMPCNPAIGGTAKGHLVRELDALGGEMARAADRACIQYRMLNRRKGPAVWSLRAQADRRAYQQVMKHTLEMQEHLTLRQAEAVALRLHNGFVTLQRGGDSLLLAGIDDPNGYADQKTPQQVAREVRDAAPEGFWLLLAHRNNLFESEYAALGADLTLSGHGHGGLWRLPFTDGLLGSGGTLLPSYTNGFYTCRGAEVFVCLLYTSPSPRD